MLKYPPAAPQNSITVYNGSAPAKTIRILLIMVLTGAPLVAIYLGFVFRTFKGKEKLDKMSY